MSRELATERLRQRSLNGFKPQSQEGKRLKFLKVSPPNEQATWMGEIFQHGLL